MIVIVINGACSRLSAPSATLAEAATHDPALRVVQIYQLISSAILSVIGVVGYEMLTMLISSGGMPVAISERNMGWCKMPVITR